MLPAPLKHAHAVGHLRFGLRGRCEMHGLPFARTSQMREPRAGDVDAMRFAGPVDGGEQLPFRLLLPDSVVAEVSPESSSCAAEVRLFPCFSDR